MMNNLFPDNLILTAVLLLWILPWKGVALWEAARKSDRKWFIALLLINTFALLDIFYIFVFSKKHKAVKSSQA